MHTTATVIGAGNGGQAIAGYLASKGFSVCLYARRLEALGAVREHGRIHGEGVDNWDGRVQVVTDDLGVAMNHSDLVFLVVTADAHGELARRMVPHVRGEKYIVLCPGRTGGALEFQAIWRAAGLRAVVAETQSLPYACRAEEPGQVKLIGLKDCVPIATFPGRHAPLMARRLAGTFGCFRFVSDVLETSLSNMGAVLHPSIAILNAGTIDRAQKFYFYHDVTERIAQVVRGLDEERLRLGRAYGIELDSVQDWMRKAYPEVQAQGLCAQMQTSPAYYDIRAPESLDSRYLTEDIPSGLVPFEALARAAGLALPLTTAIIDMGMVLLSTDFRAQGRTLDRMGLFGQDVPAIRRFVSEG